MKKNHINLGDVISIPLGDENCAMGKIIFLSKRYKNVILLSIYPMVCNILDAAIPPVENFTNRLLVYTTINPIVADRWKKVRNYSVSEHEREMSTRIVADSVWVEDNYVRPATKKDFETLPVMVVGGYLLVQKEAKKYLESLQLLNVNFN
jgi:hypothetical protein